MRMFLLSASVIAVMTSGATYAQVGPAESPATASQKTPQASQNPVDAADPNSIPGDTDTGTDIVVTAERRSTSLQRTGVAASVLTGEDLIRKSVNTVEQLQFSTPSLTVNTSGQANSFNIRGIGKSEISSSVGVGVVTYRDGVPVFPGYFQSEPYYDIQSVEVLRGPQGTFAGGNATGGAVFITETNPTLDTVKGFATAQYGNFNQLKAQGAINLPLGDTLAIRVATNLEKRDTFFTVTGPWTGNPGNLNSISGRASLLWQPDSHLRLLVKGDYNKINVGGYPNSPAYFGSANAPTLNTSDPFTVGSNTYLSGQDEFGRISANLSYTFDSGLIIRSISAFQKGTLQETIDADGTATANNTFQDFANEHIWSQEVNIISPDTGRFTWLLGGFYQYDKYEFPVGNGYVSLSPAGVVRSLRIEGTNPHTATAAFGQIGYKLTDGLQMTLGARWSRTTSRNDVNYPIELFLGALPTFKTTLVQHDFNANDNVDAKLALNWTINADHFLYAFVATGTKAGGLNGANLFGTTPRGFLPEKVTDYELGWKGTLLNGHLRTQLGGYYNVYRKFQVLIVDPATPNFTSLFNVPRPTKLYGLEASAQGSFGNFLVDFSTSVSKSELGEFFARDPRKGTTGVCDAVNGPATAAGCINLGGRRQPYAPLFTLSAGAQYAIPVAEGLTLTPRLDYAQISAVWGTLFQAAALGDYLKARNIVNAQLTLDNGTWSIAGFSTNLTDQHYIGSLNGIRRLAAAPRQYGIRVSTKF
ncbi:TonB-dependent receptor plug domain-containing protein [Sphingomonas sp. A2-49]|uniref:TonB-dependent receptor n=1 Tax=Sphingomonas sp. A2-49 TaxID=1391375 RepID=UPI0021D3D133|nr:TonB-dependent receptor [Sphingomonas sp. A2-49]MCU6454074.1 TonB-dependent receptor plug domain-containing protein [Sphingomonas sp. A2-49]